MGTRQTDVNFTQNSLSMQLKFPHMLQHPRRLSCTVLKTQLNWFYCDVVLVQKSGFLKAQLNGFCGFRVFQLRMSSAGYRPRQINIQKCANSYILNVRLYLDFFIVSYLHLSFNWLYTAFRQWKCDARNLPKNFYIQISYLLTYLFKQKRYHWYLNLDQCNASLSTNSLATTQLHYR